MTRVRSPERAVKVRFLAIGVGSAMIARSYFRCAEAIAKAGRMSQKNQKILIADENLASKNIYRRYLKDYPILWASDGRDALELFSANEFALCIVEIALQKISGLEVVREIRKTQATLPILVISEKVSTQDKQAALGAGATEFLPKPFDVFEFQKKVVGVLGFPSLSRSEEEVKQEEDALRRAAFVKDISLKLPTWLASAACPEAVKIVFQQVQKQAAELPGFWEAALGKEHELSNRLIEMSNHKDFKGFFSNKSLQKALSKVDARYVRAVVVQHALKPLFVSRGGALQGYTEKVFEQSLHKALLYDVLALRLPAEQMLSFEAVLFARIGLPFFIDVLTRLKFFAGFSKPEEMLREFQVLQQELLGKVGLFVLEKWRAPEPFAAAVRAATAKEAGIPNLNATLLRSLNPLKLDILAYYNDNKQVFAGAHCTVELWKEAVAEYQSTVDRLKSYGVLN